jgi:competence protein ComEC
MKLPAVAIAAAFASGILLGRIPRLTDNLGNRGGLFGLLIFSLATIVLGFALTHRSRIWAAAITSLICWVFLGGIAALSCDRPLPAQHIVQRIAANQIDLRTPLRWHGHLRSEPSRLPWGFGLDIDLSEVDMAGESLPLTGGLRLGFTPKNANDALPDLHTGDEIAVLTQARLPQVYHDAGAFDRRAFLAQQNIDLQATLRSVALLEKLSTAEPSPAIRLARFRARLRNSLDAMFPDSPATAGVLRAMLLGDRSFVDRAESVDFQRTGTFHVLVVAGLHVGALTFFLFWISRRLRLPQTLSTLLILGVLFSYVLVVEQRPPVLRAALMAGIVILAGFFYRRIELLNSAGLAALILLVSRPLALLDASFQLSFLAIGCIAGVALPWMERTLQPYVRALSGWRDITRDATFSPKLVQCRLDVRDAMALITNKFSAPFARKTEDALIVGTRWSFRIAELLTLSLVLQLGMLPLMAQNFHRVPLLGVFANLFAVPLTGLIVPFGFASLGASFAFPATGRILGIPLGWLVGLQAHMVSCFANLPHGSYRIPGPPAWTIVLFFLAGVALCVILRTTRTAKPWITWTVACVFSLATLLIAVHPFRPATTSGSLEVVILDVGQGDSILVVSPKGSTLLIDGGGAFHGFRGREEHLGPDPGEDAVSPYLWSRGIKTLDAVALTHAHQDHIGGLTAVLQNFHVRRLLLGRETAAPALALLKELAEKLHIPIEHEIRGQTFDWDGVRVEFLWPEISPEEIAPGAKNNDSLVIRLRYRERTILLPGDAEKQAEYAMLSENASDKLRADVLKVGHHGSKNSTMPDFLAAIAPQIAIISDGDDNPYGHPSPELLERLKQSGARILRTDQNGEVNILTDGHALSVRCFLPCAEPSAESSRVHAPDDH